MSERYERVTRLMLAEHGVRVRRWRKSMSGMAWQVYYADGTVSRLVEAPRPRGPMSAAVFLHEIGHHAIGFDRYSPRCLEEYQAWMFALRAMKKHGLPITDAVLARVADSIDYAVAKAVRRGLKRVPIEIVRYLHEHRDRLRPPPAPEPVRVRVMRGVAAALLGAKRPAATPVRRRTRSARR